MSERNPQLDEITRLLRQNREDILDGKPALRPVPRPVRVTVEETTVLSDNGALIDHAMAVSVLTRRYTLTPRESEVIGLVLLGRDNLSIASQLRVKLRTAKTHVEHIWQKTGVGSRAQLMGLLFGEDQLGGDEYE